jgi:hypothetical protein
MHEQRPDEIVDRQRMFCDEPPRPIVAAQPSEPRGRELPPQRWRVWSLGHWVTPRVMSRRERVALLLSALPAIKSMASRRLEICNS